MRARNAAIAFGVLVFVSSLAVAQAPVDSNIAVTSYAQSRGTPCSPAAPGNTGCGGCYPDGLPPGTAIGDALAQLPKVNPEWQAIGPMIPVGSGGDPTVPPAAAPVRITGTIALSKSPGDDFPASHFSPDYNAEILPDDTGRLATGNTNNKVEFEWEGDLFPMFAWAGENDKVIAEGRWIFDCGHPDPGPLGKCSGDANATCIINSDCTGAAGVCAAGQCKNDTAVSCTSDANCNFGTCTNPAANFAYQSEMHPPYAAVMIRNKSLPAPHAGRTAPAIPAAQADVYISANGGGAGDLCTVSHLHNDGDVLFTKACFINHCSVTIGRSCKLDKDCAHGETCIGLDPAGRLNNINASNFVFDLPLPLPPSDTATLQIKTKNFKPAGGLMPKATFVVPTPPLGPTPVLHVIVPMATPLPNGKMPNVFAQRISAGWKEDTTSLTHVQIKFKSLTITNPLKESNTALPHVCTNQGPGLSATTCSKDSDCPAGGCNNGHACHSDKDCSKLDNCTNASHCVGGVVPGWKLWSEVNGDWIEFKKLETIGAKAPFLQPPYVQPSPTPLKIPESFKFDEYVPPTGAIHIKATGHSLNCLSTLFGHNLQDGLQEFGLTLGATCLNAGSKGAGTVEVTHNGPDFGTVTPGTPVTFTATSSGGEGGTCSTTTTRLCVTNADCPMSETCTITGDAYTLEYTVAIIP